MLEGYKDFITQRERAETQILFFVWDQDNGKKEGTKEEKNQILGM